MIDNTVTHKRCPDYIARTLEVAGGKNRYGLPNFRVVWGWDRLIKVHGQWEDWEEREVFDPTTVSLRNKQIRLKSRVIETREIPKYLPPNCWHLEMWRPPEEYGTPETWSKLGEEIIGTQTIDTAGPFPHEGEYELCFPLTDSGNISGQPLPLVNSMVEMLVGAIKVSRESFSFAQRRAAIEQDQARKEAGYTANVEDTLREGLRPFAGEKFVTVPGSKILRPS
jgi:hypothetical protein